MDVTVRGGGVFGLSIAYACALRGARVRVIERHSIGAGASGGIVGALAPHVPEAWNTKKQFQLDSLLMAPEFWAGVEAVSGCKTGYARQGRLQPVPAGGLELARARGIGAQSLWQGAAEWQVIERGDWGPVSPTGWFVHDTLTARISPRAACFALAAAVTALGGDIVLGEGADRGAVVWATGVDGLAGLSADLGSAVGRGEKGQALLLRFDAPGRPQILADGLHIVPHWDGTVAVGSTSERVFEGLNTDELLDALHARAVGLMPVLAGAAVLERWAGLRPRAATRAPVMGQWPGRAGWFVANGGFKIGFGMAPMVATVMADLVLEGRDRVPEGFRVLDAIGKQ